MSSAWKMRAVVYGMLAAVAVLVLVARPSASGMDGPRPDVYTGHTAQGTHLAISLAGRRFASLNAAGIWASCKGRPRVGSTWSPVEGQSNVTVWQHGSEFTVHERPSPAFPQPPGTRINLWLRGSLNADVHRIDGVITYLETGARGGCASGPIRFGVSR
jgi:hypothetical protein